LQGEGSHCGGLGKTAIAHQRIDSYVPTAEMAKRIRRIDGIADAHDVAKQAASDGVIEKSAR
jgi:hypothetical protein